MLMPAPFHLGELGCDQCVDGIAMQDHCRQAVRAALVQTRDTRKHGSTSTRTHACDKCGTATTRHYEIQANDEMCPPDRTLLAASPRPSPATTRICLLCLAERNVDTKHWDQHAKRPLPAALPPKAAMPNHPPAAHQQPLGALSIKLQRQPNGPCAAGSPDNRCARLGEVSPWQPGFWRFRG